MKISTKGRYATRVMLDLAENENGSYISLKEIAERQEISVKYLEQIVSLLKMRLCNILARKLRRLPAYQKTGGIHNRGYPARGGGKSCSGFLRGGRFSVRQRGNLPHMQLLEGLICGGKPIYRQCDACRFDEKRINPIDKMGFA